MFIVLVVLFVTVVDWREAQIVIQVLTKVREEGGKTGRHLLIAPDNSDFFKKNTVFYLGDKGGKG